MAVLALALLSLGAGTTSAETWIFSAGGALAGGYSPFPRLAFHATGMPQVAVQRAVHPDVWVRTEVGYEDFIGLTPKPGIFLTDVIYPPTSTRESRARFLFLAAGARWQPAPRPPRNAAFYVEAMPTLFGVMWRDRYSYTIYDTSGASLRSADDDLTRLVPGFIGGVGLRFRATDRWHVDYGVRYQRSARIKGMEGRDLLGLSQLALAAALTWMP
jgi:hypothetical protein